MEKNIGIGADNFRINNSTIEINIKEVEKIIIKLDNQFNDKTGAVIPVFYFQNNGYSTIETVEFPNNGKIFITDGIEKIQENSFYTFDKEKLSLNNKYEESLENYSSGNILYTNKNPSKYVANYFYAGIKKILPIDLIAIYGNNFSLKTQKLTDSNKIEREVFFLENDDYLYGPFKRNYLELDAFNFSSCRDEFEESEEFLDFLELYSDYDGKFISKIKKDVISNFLIKDSYGNLYLTDFKSIVENKIGEYFLFWDDSDLLDWGKKTIAKQKPELKSVIDVLDTNYLTKTVEKTDKLKWQRFKELLQDKIEDDKIEDLKKILSEKGFLAREEDSKYLEDLQKRLENKDNEIVDLKTELSNIKSEQPMKADNSDFDLDSYPKIREAIENLEQLEALLKESTNVEFYKGQLKSVKEQYESENQKLSKLKEEKDKLNSETQKIINSFTSAKDSLTSDLAKAKIYTDLLNGIDVDISQSSEKHNSGNIFVPLINDVTKNSAKEYVQEIRERLKNQGRDLSVNEVTNLIVTVNQSFLTILAGAPGVGKTSLAEKFSKSLGLSEQFGYLEIPCAKGWSSSKDLIGFYNPLNQRFQASKTKLKSALEASSNYKNAPYIVLLDEANLSPMEHYWSDFIKLADFDYDRKIKFSDKETIEFGEGFRFLATINHDHTTEMLSNRLLDRASIIQIEKPTNFDEKQLHTSLSLNEIFNFNTVNTLFKDTSKWKSEERSLNNKLDEVINQLEANHSGLIISPRKRNSVINYMRVATGLLEGNDYIALDYAISQQILQLLNLRGDNHFETLKNLKKLLQDVGMEKSTALLNRIIERGKEFKHFKYIYY